EASWCGAVDRAIGTGDARGFHCLKVPNFLITGFYGPERNPERSDFVNACFNGNADAAKRLRMNVPALGDLHFRYSAPRSLENGGAVDLSFLGPWAPKVSASNASANDVDVDVDLVDAEIRVLSSVGEILAQEFDSAAEDSPLRNALDTCIHSV